MSDNDNDNGNDNPPPPSPVIALHGMWVLTKKKHHDDGFDFEPHRICLKQHIDFLKVRPTCPDFLNPSHKGSCSCMATITLTTKQLELTVDSLIKFAIMLRKHQQAKLKEWMTYVQAASKTLVGFGCAAQAKVFILPGSESIMICRNALGYLIGFNADAWQAVKGFVKHGVDPHHGLDGFLSNNFKLEYDDASII